MSTDNNNNLQGFKLEAKGRGSILQEARRFISMRSPEKEMKIQAANECICKRKLMGILCRSCGGVFRGRVRQICVYHPTSRYLMDYEVCPSCKATQLTEFEETIPSSDMECEKERNA